MDVTTDPQRDCMQIVAAESADAKQATKNRSKRLPWKRAFIKHLSKHGNVWRACQETPIDHGYAYRMRSKSERFKTAWNNAKKLARKRYIDLAEQSCQDLGIDGYDDPVYQGGVLVGHRKKYATDLTRFRLAAEMPRKYSRKSEVRTTSQSHVLVSVQMRNALLFGDSSVVDASCALDAALARPIVALPAPVVIASSVDVEPA